MKRKSLVKTTQAQPARRRRVRSVMQKEDGERALVEREVEVSGAEAEAKVLAARLATVFAEQLDFYTRFAGLTPEEARAKAAEVEANPRETVAAMPPKERAWWHIHSLARVDFQASVEAWEEIKQAAREELATGVRVSEVIYPNASAWERAQHCAMREEMADGWKPQNGIEHTLIDMLALSYTMYLHWTEIGHTWATHTVERLHKMQEQSPCRSERRWKSPNSYETDAVDRAHRLADGYNRQFLRVLRQLRDLRRYVPPVIVNNGGQVNIASDGGQQLNVK